MQRTVAMMHCCIACRASGWGGDWGIKTKRPIHPTKTIKRLMVDKFGRINLGVAINYLSQPSGGQLSQVQGRYKTPHQY